MSPPSAQIASGQSRSEYTPQLWTHQLNFCQILPLTSFCQIKFLFRLWVFQYWAKVLNNHNFSWKPPIPFPSCSSGDSFHSLVALSPPLPTSASPPAIEMSERKQRHWKVRALHRLVWIVVCYRQWWCCTLQRLVSTVVQYIAMPCLDLSRPPVRTQLMQKCLRGALPSRSCSLQWTFGSEFGEG